MGLATCGSHVVSLWRMRAIKSLEEFTLDAGSVRESWSPSPVSTLCGSSLWNVVQGRRVGGEGEASDVSVTCLRNPDVTGVTVS